MNGARSIFYAKGLPAHCPCRGCAACGVFWDGVCAECQYRVRAGRAELDSMEGASPAMEDARTPLWSENQQCSGLRGCSGAPGVRAPIEKRALAMITIDPQRRHGHDSRWSSHSTVVKICGFGSMATTVPSYSMRPTPSLTDNLDEAGPHGCRQVRDCPLVARFTTTMNGVHQAGRSICTRCRRRQLAWTNSFES